MSETRSRYPYQDDRAVIDAFLMGLDFVNDDSYLRSVDGVLMDSSIADTVANYSDYNRMGELRLFIRSPNKTLPFFIERIANYMLEALGSDERLTREINTHDEGAVNWRWVYEGKYISPNEPIVLCGEMTLAAYRATKRMSA